eukprot:comp11576_c0_seq1/m.6050 comp11576_c0_seq1/g.6050  ORF comp11576_c0_seq1/g.6050 comp11576_c0_seq1/m.6050 type:complete len:302 (-) comp11576_c0_seq1:364-1269(-)
MADNQQTRVEEGTVRPVAAPSTTLANPPSGGAAAASGSGLAEEVESTFFRLKKWGLETFSSVPTNVIKDDPELEVAIEKIRTIKTTYGALQLAFSRHKKAFETLIGHQKDLSKFFMEEGVREQGLTGEAMRTMGEALRGLHQQQQEMVPLYTRVDDSWRAFDSRAVADALDSVKKAEEARTTLDSSRLRLQEAEVGKDRNPRRHQSAVDAVAKAQTDYNKARGTVLAKAAMLDLQRGELLKRDLSELNTALAAFGKASSDLLEGHIQHYNQALNAAPKPDAPENLALFRRHSSIPNPSVSV